MGAREYKWHQETVTKAEPAVQKWSGIVGWNLSSTAGCIWLTSEQCALTPQPGEVAEFLGEGFGRIVEGIRIGGRTYR